MPALPSRCFMSSVRSQPFSSILLSVMVIDVHTHIFPDELAAKAMATLGASIDVKPHLDGTAAELVRSMDRAGIDMSVVCPVATKPGQVRRANEWACSLDTERFIAFGTLHPEAEDVVADIRHAAAAGVKGFKIHPEYQDFSPLEGRALPWWEAIAEAGLPVLFHAGVDIEIPTVHGTPHAFALLNDRLPELVMILAHMGSFRMWDEVRRHLVGRDVYFDTSYVHADLPRGKFLDLCREHGATRIMFGSDSPWGEQTAELEAVRDSGLAPQDVDAVLGENAARLLGIRT